MTPIHQIRTLIPLAVGSSAVVSTILIHALALSATVNLVRRERRLGRAGASFYRCGDRRAGDVIRARGAPDRDRRVGGVVRTLWRILRARNSVLPLSGQLHDLGLR